MQREFVYAKEQHGEQDFDLRYFITVQSSGPRVVWVDMDIPESTCMRSDSVILARSEYLQV